MITKYLLTLIFLSSFTLITNAQTVNIPDANFKNYLITNPNINTNFDGNIQVSEAIAFTGTIFADNKFITNLTGIEAFLNLTTLYCRGNNLTTLNVASNAALVSLYCGGTNLSTLNVANNIQLQVLDIRFNQIDSLYLNNNINLEYLSINNNNFTALNITNNTNIKSLTIDYNAISNLNLSNNGALEILSAPNCSLITLNLVNNPVLLAVIVQNNNLTSLNIANGNNTILSATNAFNTQNNPNLSCIQVDDVAYSTANWTIIDTSTSFSTNCSVGIDEQTLFSGISLYPNPTNGYFNLYVNSAALDKELTVKVIDVTGKTVKQQNIQAGKNSFGVLSLPQGFYSVVIYGNSTIVTTKKLLITH